jgi:hypothetical protein
MIIRDEREGSYNIDDYEIVEFSVAAPTITLETHIIFASVLQCEDTIHAR